jgi:hypothetical protein
MSKVTKTAVAACVGTIALAGATIEPVKAADMPPYGPPPVSEGYQYGPPQQESYVEERYVYSEPAPAYRPPALVPIAPPVVAYEAAPPAVVVEPEPYHVRRRVYVEPGYRYAEPGYRRGPGTYYAGYGYERGWGHGHRRW